MGTDGRMTGAEERRHTGRLVLVAFLATFTIFRTIIFLIMDRRLPDMFVYVGGTHVHHLNLGIVMLSIVGAYLLLKRPQGHDADWAAVLYGIGLALTFDEFGMWLHLGGSYWQRASFDAITVIAGFLALLAFGPSIKEIRGRHAAAVIVLLVLAGAFFLFFFREVNKYGGRVGPRRGGTKPAQSQSAAASGTAARSASAIALRAQALRQMPQP